MVKFITNLLLVAEKDTILVVCNKLFKITHFIATTEEILVERLARLFRDDVWKLHRLLESVVSDRGPQFAANLTKELNRMLGIEMKFSTLFYPQTDDQTERMNQELEQYLRFFVGHRQKNWLEQLVSAEFVVNNRVHSATKISLFMTNYSRKLRIEVDIRGKEKVKKVIEFIERIKRVQKKAGATLRKMQKEIK